MTKNVSEIEHGLEHKGFRRREGDHHYFIYYSNSGLKTRVFTKTSHSHRDINDSLIAQMAKQCKVSKQHFLNLVDCPLDRNAYEELLTQQNLL